MKIKSPLFVIALACIATSPLWSMFVQFSLEQIVDRAEVIVLGRIVKIEYPENKEATSKTTRIQTGPNEYRVKTESTGVILYDTAFVLVEEILKKQESSELKVGDLVPFSMPSRFNLTMSSTDIKYDVEDAGIWILNRDKGAYWASHPMSLQQLEKREDIKTHLKHRVQAVE